MRSIELVGCRFRSEPATGLVFTIDRVTQRTVLFHAEGEIAGDRRLPVEALMQRLDARTLVVCEGNSLEAVTPKVYRAVRRSLMAVGAPPPQPAPIQEARAALAAQILAALADGPKAMRDLRSLLKIQHQPILHALNALLVSGQVKRLGRSQTIRWALATWTPTASDPAAHTPGKILISEKPKPAPAEKTSWWIRHAAPDADRAAFSADLAHRHKTAAGAGPEVGLMRGR